MISLGRHLSWHSASDGGFRDLPYKVHITQQPRGTISTEAMHVGLDVRAGAGESPMKTSAHLHVYCTLCICGRPIAMPDASSTSLGSIVHVEAPPELLLFMRVYRNY